MTDTESTVFSRKKAHQNYRQTSPGKNLGVVDAGLDVQDVRLMFIFFNVSQRGGFSKARKP